MRNKEVCDYIKGIYKEYTDFIPLHDPRFVGNEKQYLNDCIESNFVSSVGEYVARFEDKCAEYTGAKYAVAAVNGTNALHMALLMAGVEIGDEVITQSLTFIATANAITYSGAKPIFIDVDKETMGLSPSKLEDFLHENAIVKDDGYCYNRITNKKIAACVPMHTFGHPVKLADLIRVCEKFNIVLVEDSAESLGSKYKGRHTGTFGRIGILSFNGNKIITSGGGGMILTDDEGIAKRAKHLTTQAKVPHQWEFVHDQIGYNYRMTNINAALGCAQIENLDRFILAKRELASRYKEFFDGSGLMYFVEPEHCESNYWLNVIITNNLEHRNEFLDYTNKNGVMTRPIWTLMSKLSMFENCQTGNLENSEWFEERVVNIPSSVPIPYYYNR